MDALAASAASPLLSSFFAAMAAPDLRWVGWIGLANLAFQAWHHATSGDNHRATTLRLGRMAGGVGRAVVVPVRVGGGSGLGGGIGGGRKVRRRVRRPLGVGRAK